MWQEESVMEINSKKEKIWPLWTDVKNWNKWNVGVEYSYLNGYFENGVNGSFKTFIGSKPLFLFFVLKNCIFDKSFTMEIKLALCNMDIGYELMEEENRVKIKHYIKIRGPLTFIHKKNIGGKIWERMPKSIERLAEMAKE
jgi:hypothetical protein